MNPSSRSLLAVDHDDLSAVLYDFIAFNSSLRYPNSATGLEKVGRRVTAGYGRKWSLCTRVDVSDQRQYLVSINLDLFELV